MPESAALAHRDLQIAELSIQPGNTYQVIADRFKLTKGRICQILQKPQVKEVIDQGINQLVALVPLAIDNYLNILSDTEHRDFYKANKDILQNTGIIASHTSNVFIDKIIMKQQLIINDPTALKAIGKYVEDDIIDIDLGLEDTE